MRNNIILSGFTMAAVSHINYGMWRDPQDQSYRYTDIEYWVGLARLLEENGFDCLFIADALGLIDSWQGSPAASLAQGIQSPLIDPLLLVSAMAAQTQRLGFGITVSTTYEQPYLLARKFTTLDHLTNGRIAWNVVTSQLESAARNLGLDKQMDHDERYDRADEFLTVSYKLWQRSWERAALKRDKAAGIYSDPQKVHAVNHRGRWFSVPDAHLSEPSPQRTPVIFQAGGSPRGIDFAARHAEVVFVAGLDASGVRRQVAAIKARAAELGRAPGAIKFISAVTVITGESEQDAQARYAERRARYDLQGALIHYGASTGVDLSGHSLDAPLAWQQTNSNRSLLKMVTGEDGQPSKTLREVFHPEQGLGRQKTFVGSGDSVAAQLERWLAESDTDGINLAQWLSPGCFEDFARWVIPALKQRGLLGNPTEVATLRQRLFPDGGAEPATDHPAKINERK
ncbi:MAG: LLM class flavin-dependent oxidoreductase [Kluyvera sp.]|uniref:LLM class flavin-dependent oxidoreductase n=1 Tax=Kluyvera sp. TaxID=1538228 RepID=UPI003A83D382